MAQACEQEQGGSVCLQLLLRTSVCMHANMAQLSAA